MLNVWTQVIDTIYGNSGGLAVTTVQEQFHKYWQLSLDSVDYVPASMPLHREVTRLIMVEDNDAVIKMLKKGRAPAMAHVTRTHRVNLDWLLEPLLEDPGVSIRHVSTKAQVADIFTNAGFQGPRWDQLLDLAGLRLPMTFLMVVASHSLESKSDHRNARELDDPRNLK